MALVKIPTNIYTRHSRNARVYCERPSFSGLFSSRGGGHEAVRADRRSGFKVAVRQFPTHRFFIRTYAVSSGSGLVGSKEMTFLSLLELLLEKILAFLESKLGFTISIGVLGLALFGGSFGFGRRVAGPPPGDAEPLQPKVATRIDPQILAKLNGARKVGLWLLHGRAARFASPIFRSKLQLLVSVPEVLTGPSSGSGAAIEALPGACRLALTLRACTDLYLTAQIVDDQEEAGLRAALRGQGLLGPEPNQASFRAAPLARSWQPRGEQHRTGRRCRSIACCAAPPRRARWPLPVRSTRTSTWTRMTSQSSSFLGSSRHPSGSCSSGGRMGCWETCLGPCTCPAASRRTSTACSSIPTQFLPLYIASLSFDDMFKHPVPFGKFLAQASSLAIPGRS